MAAYSGTPLIKKLGIKAGKTLYVSHPPAAYFDWLSPLADTITVMSRLVGKADFIHLFVSDDKVFQQGISKTIRRRPAPSENGWDVVDFMAQKLVPSAV
jgi:hypothetical protein